MTSITYDVTPTTPLITQGGTTCWSAKVRVQWTVRGRVTHWGHSHQRADRWSALFQLQGLPTDGGLLKACSKNEFPGSGDSRCPLNRSFFWFVLVEQRQLLP